MLFVSFIMLFAFQTIASSMSFIEMAKNNPKVFVDLIDAADPKAVGQIIKILEGMIVEVENKIRNVDDDLKDAQDALADGLLDDNNQGKKCAAINANLTAKAKIMNTAKGAFDEAAKTKNEREDPLNKELKTLREVLTKVKTLQTSPQNKSRRLLAIDTELSLVAIKENPQALLESLVDADPKKVSKVIELLELLISEASTELTKVIKDFKDTQKAYADAAAVHREVVASHNVCKTEQQQTGKTVEELKAALAATKAFHATWKPQYLTEKDTLLEIIELLKSTM